MIKVKCRNPKCAKVRIVPDAMAGSTLKCAGCGGTLAVPGGPPPMPKPILPPPPPKPVAVVVPEPEPMIEEPVSLAPAPLPTVVPVFIAPVVPPGVPDDPVWHYESDGAALGPVPLSALLELLRGGKLTPSSRVWKDGMADWQEAGAMLPRLFAASAPAAVPVVPESKGDPVERANMKLWVASISLMAVVSIGLIAGFYFMRSKGIQP